MHRANEADPRGAPGPQGTVACEDCSVERSPDEVGWVRVWLDEKYLPPIMLIYCPRCAEQFEAYSEDVSPIEDR